MKRLRAGIQIIIKVIITLASGKKQVISVTVQKTTVRTTKITGLKSSVTVARNKKLTLKPVISPITSQEKVTYSSSNKKIATVSSSGVITGKKKGTAYITDIGMTGPVKSVIGMDISASLKRFETTLPEKYKLADGNCILNGCIFEINDESCRVEKITRVVRK